MKKALIVSLIGCILGVLSGCSFKIETGWHGTTGRDDRMQTQLIKTVKQEKF